MKIVIFIYSLGGGGAERVTVNLANHWVQKGWDITVVTLAPLDLDFYELHPAIQRISLDMVSESGNALVGLVQNLRRVFALRAVLRRLNPDIALSMMTAANVLLALAAIGLHRIGTIGSERAHPPQYRLGFLWETMRRHAYRHLAAVVALTEETGLWLENNTTSRRVKVIPNAAVWPLPIQQPRLERISVGVPERRLLLAVGRLDKGKGFDCLIAAFAMLALRYPEWDLAILGEGEERTRLHDQVRQSGMECRVFLPGSAGNVGEWYDWADLYVMSSRSEGFPNTLIEAMAYGVPAVSFDCDTGPRDIIRHQVDGLLVPAGSVSDLSSALSTLMGDDNLRKRFATLAVSVRTRFSGERINGLWESLFNEIHKSRNP